MSSGSNNKIARPLSRFYSAMSDPELAKNCYFGLLFFAPQVILPLCNRLPYKRCKPCKHACLLYWHHSHSFWEHFQTTMTTTNRHLHNESDEFHDSVVLWSEEFEDQSPPWSPAWDTNPKVLMQSLEDLNFDVVASHDEEDDTHIRNSVDGFDV